MTAIVGFSLHLDSDGGRSAEFQILRDAGLKAASGDAVEEVLLAGDGLAARPHNRQPRGHARAGWATVHLIAGEDTKVSAAIALQAQPAVGQDGAVKKAKLRLLRMANLTLGCRRFADRSRRGDQDRDWGCTQIEAQTFGR